MFGSGGGGQWVETCRVADGPRGGPGAEVATQPSTNQPGADGVVSLLEGQDEHAQAKIRSRLATSVSLLYLETTLREAERAYANSELEAALDHLSWLGELVLTPTVCRSARACRDDSGLVDEPLEGSEEFAAVRTKVFVLLRRMVSGLDYWGNLGNFVPLLGRSIYEDATEQMLTHARNVEEAYIGYRDAASDWSVARRKLNEGIDAQERFLSSLEGRTLRIGEIETDLVRDIEALSSAYESSWMRVMAAGEDFKAAVMRESNGCEFKDVVTAVAVIGTAVASAGTGAGVALAAWKAYGEFDRKKHDPKDKLGSLAEPKYKLEKVATIGKGVAEVAKGVGQIVDVLTPSQRPSGPELPSDAGKLLMSRHDLQATVEPFRHLPEARDYLATVDAFIELVTARNNKIIEYNALADARAETLADEEKGEGEIARLREQLNRSNTQHLPEFASFMGRANAQNKRTLIQMLYHQHRALEYWAGETYPFRVSRDSVVHLAQTHAQQLPRLLQAMENRGRTPERFQFDDGKARFSLKADVDPEAFKDFIRSGRAVFSLPTQRFEGFALVRLDYVRLSLPGLTLKPNPRDNDPIELQLVHYGSARLTSLSDRVIEFSHEPRSTYFFYRFGTDPSRSFSLGGEHSTFIKLAPNGPWSLILKPEDRERIELSSLSDVVLEFEGEFFSLRR